MERINLHDLPIEQLTTMYEDAITHELSVLSDLVFKIQQWQVSKVESVQELQSILAEVDKHLERLQEAMYKRLVLAHVMAPMFDEWSSEILNQIKEK